MPKDYSSIDLDFSYDGDLLLSSEGDIKDTSENLLLSFQNEIFNILKSDSGDWLFSPQIGANLSTHIGEPNNEVTGTAIRNRIISSLSVIANPADISCRVVPVSAHRVFIVLRIAVLATRLNKLNPGDVLQTGFLYDYKESGIFVPVSDLNKYVKR